jgi:hypothetical protein
VYVDGVLEQLPNRKGVAYRNGIASDEDVREFRVSRNGIEG